MESEIDILNEEISKLKSEISKNEEMRGVKRDFASFARTASDILGGINSRNYRKNSDGTTKWSTDEIKQFIIDSNEEELRVLSKAYYNRSGLYKRMIRYFATALTYDYLIVPKTVGSKKPSNSQIEDAMSAGYEIMRKFDIEINFADIITEMLIEGVYYGFVKEYDNGKAIFQKIEPDYCRSRFISANGLKMMEFNLNYFYSIQNDTLITDEALLATFPIEIQKSYKQFLGKVSESDKGVRKLKKGINATIIKNNGLSWILVPEEIGAVFYYRDKRPFLSTVVEAIADLDDYKGLEKKLDKQELAKILIQKLPINEDGELIFTTAEAAEIHRAGVNMLENNDSVDVMTTFADVEMLDLQKSGSTDRDNLEKMERSVYNEAGLSKNLFASEGTTALDYSVRTDCALAYDMAKQFVPFMNYHINKKNKKSKIFLVFLLLPITQYNREDMFDLYLKAAEYGYSKLLPGIASGIKQSDMIDLMHYENDVLALHDVMVPVQSAHTTSGNQEAGAPVKKDSDKQDITLKTEESK